jgi:hypothetical protein
MAQTCHRMHEDLLQFGTLPCDPRSWRIGRVAELSFELHAVMPTTEMEPADLNYVSGDAAWLSGLSHIVVA